MDKSDIQLIENAKRDKEQFSFLYKKYFGKVYNYFWYRTGHNHDVSEDLTQETFVRAFNNLSEFQIKHASYFSYLLVIAHNLLVNYYRKPKEASFGSEADIPVEVWGDIEEKDDVKLLWQAIQQLNYVERDALFLKYRKGYKTKEIAEIMDKTENAVKLILSRTRKKLKENPILSNVASFVDKKQQVVKGRYLK